MSASTLKLFNRNFLLFWSSTFCAEFGTALGGVALSFLVLEQTGSVSAMGVTLGLTLLPSVFAPLAGALIDRWPLKPPLVIGGLLRATALLGVAVLAAAGSFSLGLVYAVSLVNGLIDMFSTPAAHSAVPALVAPKDLVRAGGLMGIAIQGMQFVGLVGGGMLVGLLGHAAALAANGALMLVMAVLVSSVRLPARSPAAAQPNFWLELRSGVRLIRHSRVLLLLLAVVFAASAAFAPLELLVPQRMVALGLGAQGYGVFFGVMMLGMLIGSSSATILGNRVSASTFVSLGLCTAAAAFFGLAGAVSFAANLLWAAVIGLGLAGVQVGATAFEQERVPGAYRGRVFGLQTAAVALAVPGTLFVLSGLAEYLELAWLLVAGGVVMAGLAVFWMGVMGQTGKPVGRAERRAVSGKK